MKKYNLGLGKALISAVLICTLTNCKSKDERVQDAIKEGNKMVQDEQREAAHEISKAQLKLEQVEKDKQQAVDKAAEALIHERNEANQEISQAQLDADKKLEKAVTQ